MALIVNEEQLSKLLNDLSGRSSEDALYGPVVQIASYGKRPDGHFRFAVELTRSQTRYLQKSVIPQRTLKETYAR